MALSAGMTWEVRRGSSGSGGYDLVVDGGTDYSQQDAPQIADPADWEFKNNDYDRIYSATEDANLVAALEDNTILISGDGGSGAFTPGTYHITGTGADGGGNYIDIDRDAGTANAADGNGVVGGAADIEDIDSKVIAGNKVYIEYDATDYAPAGIISFTGAGAAGSRIIIIGYESTRDDDPIPGGNQPTFAGGANYFQVNSNTIVKHINFETATGDYAFYSAGTKVWLVRCRAYNPNAAANKYGVYFSSNSHIVGCEIICTNGRAIRINSASHIIHSYIHDSDMGILAVVAGTAIEHCTFDTIATVAIPGASVLDVLIQNSNFYSCVDGITGDAAFTATIMNNEFVGCTDGIHLSAVGNQFIDWNNYWNNGGNDVTNCTKGDNATGVDPGFTDAAGGDFGSVDQVDAYIIEVGVG